MAMPFAQMLDALQAIEDLDLFILERLRWEPTAEMTAEKWCEEIEARRRSRAQLVEIRLMLENGELLNA